MILWGIVILSRFGKVSGRYRRLVWVSLVIAALATGSAFLNGILSPLTSVEFYIFQNNLNFALVAALVLCNVGVAGIGIVAFCVCMMDFCSHADWESARASWKHTLRLTFLGTMLLFVFIICAIVYARTLEFEPYYDRNAISWTSTSTYQGSRVVGRYKGEIIYEKDYMPGETIITPPEGFGPQYHDEYFRIGNWWAPTSPKYSIFSDRIIMPFVIYLFATLMHFMVSLSRTIRAARK